VQLLVDYEARMYILQHYERCYVQSHHTMYCTEDVNGNRREIRKTGI
jgi:hypothetical protein